MSVRALIATIDRLTEHAAELGFGVVGAELGGTIDTVEPAGQLPGARRLLRDLGRPEPRPLAEVH